MDKLKKASYKRGFDLTFLVVSHFFLAPLLLVLWVVIPLLIWREDKGPVFYCQKRCGKNGKELTVLKFRTMVINAEKLGPAWTEESDLRITPIGRFLRKTALDELPQTINILKGEMSWVGSRPFDVDEQKLLEKQIPGFKKRLMISPGLTSLAEVYDSTDDPLATLHYELDYIGKMGSWLDLKLLFLSLVNTFLGRWDRRSGKRFHKTNKNKDNNRHDFNYRRRRQKH